MSYASIPPRGGVVLLAIYVSCIGLTGCVPAPPAEPPVVPELTPGEDHQDSLLPGGTSTLRMAVNARTFYAVWLSTSGGFTVGATLTGTPLAAPIDIKLSFLNALSAEPQGRFYAQSDGELQIVVSNNAQQGTGLLTSILFGGNMPTPTTLRIDDLGTDDHGETLDKATAIVPDGQPIGGTLVYGETYDYFTLPVQLGDLFNVKVEATREVTLATTNVDRFGRFNFNVATTAGNRLSLTPRPGVPATNQFAIAASESTGQVLLALKAASGLFLSTPTFADYPIEYAITVEQVTSQQLWSGDARSGHLDAGFTAQYFVDVPHLLGGLQITLSGPDGLALYVRRGQPASFERFDFYMVLGGGTATDTLTIGRLQTRVDRYYLTVDSILGQAADYILSVEIR